MQQGAETQPGRKGPRVFLDYTQSELDAAYDQAIYAPNRQQCQDRKASLSAAVRARLGEPERFAYGPSEVERVDVYRTAAKNAPIFILIHGGAWRNGVARDNAYAAESLVFAGAHFVVPDFIQVQDAGGSLVPMVEQVRRAVAWLHENAQRFGGDPNRLHLGGHSSGGHLASCALITDWAKEFGLPGDTIKGAMLCSGMYDLKGPRLSARSQYVAFTDAMEESLSAMRHLERITMPVIVAYGTHETPEFQRQGRDFHAALKAARKPVELVVGEHYNHFEMPDTLSNPFSLLGRAVFAQMGLKLTPA